MGGSCFQRFGVAVLCVAVLGPAMVTTAEAQSSRTWDRGFGSGPARAEFERGYDAGVRLGEQDASRGRGFDLARRPFSNERDDFRRGFTDGYRAGFARLSSQQPRRPGNPRDGAGRRPPQGLSEPAAARGFSDGYEDGVNDRRRGDRYDPVSSRDYRDGDKGYFEAYGGSRDAYRTNYRAGFRQGYEEGYRDGARARR